MDLCTSWIHRIPESIETLACRETERLTAPFDGGEIIFCRARLRVYGGKDLFRPAASGRSSTRFGRLPNGSSRMTSVIIPIALNAILSRPVKCHKPDRS